jgi:hypothetical protein
MFGSSWKARRAALGLVWLTACAAPHPPPAAPAKAVVSVGERRAAGPDVLAANGFELPSRRPVDPHAGVEPLALPAELAAPIELTLTLTLGSAADGRAPDRQQDVARGSDRVHIRSVAGVSEWLFIRNSIDTRRVSARRVEHLERVIIEYDESELAMSGIARGWADVASIGVQHEGLQRLSRTGRSERHFGFEFVERRSPTGAGDDAVWWSDEAALPWLVSGGERRQVLRVTSLQRGVDRARFREPLERFPGYRVLDIADYREKHHEAPAHSY